MYLGLHLNRAVTLDHMRRMRARAEAAARAAREPELVLHVRTNHADADGSRPWVLFGRDGEPLALGERVDDLLPQAWAAGATVVCVDEQRWIREEIDE